MNAFVLERELGQGAKGQGRRLILESKINHLIYHMVIARKQTLVQLSDELIEELDREAARRSLSRSALIREAVEGHLAAAGEAEAIRRYVESYRRFPQSEIEAREGEQRGIRMIREEPW